MSSKKKYLTIDASSDLAIEIMRDDTYYRSHCPTDKVDEVILVEIDKIFHKVKLSIEKLDAIAVNHGPGNFNGLRVSLVIAKTMASFFKIPLYSFDSFDAIYRVMPNNPNRLLNIFFLKIGRNNFFVSGYCDGKRIFPIRNFKKLEFENFLSIDWWKIIFFSSHNTVDIQNKNHLSVSLNLAWEEVAEKIEFQITHQKQWLNFFTREDLDNEYLEQISSHVYYKKMVVFRDELSEKISLMKCLEDKINNNPEGVVSPLTLVPQYHRSFQG